MSSGEARVHASPLPEPALPWTEHWLRRSTPDFRKRVQFLSESAPRLRDLRYPRSYRDGLRLHRALTAENYTMLYPLRGRALLRFARHAERDELPGALVDCGTYNGGSTALLSAGAPRREVWAFDSFEGLPEPSERDADRPLTEEEKQWPKGRCLGSEERLREAVRSYGAVDRLHVRKGWFEDTLPTAGAEIGPIAVLHCDGDWYDSVWVTLESLYANVSRGGAIIIDDYGAVPSAGQATRDFKASVGDATPMSRIDQTGYFWRKP
jgi:Macrocin-O-methyltransferase (TylF)